MCKKKNIRNITVLLLSKIPYRILKELNRVSLLLMGIGRIPSIDEEVRKILELSKDLEEFDFLDIGANVGNYSLEVYKQNPYLRIFSFEPSKLTFSSLCRNLRALKIQCFNIGFGENIKVEKLYFDSPESGLASLSKRNLSHFQIEFELSEEVQIMTLDSWLANHELKDNLVVKMDIEGHELFALRGAQTALQKRIKVLQFEFGGVNVSSGVFFIDIWSKLRDNFTIYRLTANGLKEIPGYSENLENFVNTTYYAKAKP